MLAYAMAVLGLLSLLAVLFSVESYLKRRNPRDLLLLASGWLAYGASAPFFYLTSVSGGALYPALFGALQLVGICLIVMGAFSYFVAFNHVRAFLVTLALGVVAFTVLLTIPGTTRLIIPAENIIMFTSAILGLSRPREFRAVGGSSYYWLLGVVVLGALAALGWMPQASTGMGVAPVWPWIGTTAVVLSAVVFMAELENNATLTELRAREAELLEYRADLERMVEERTEQLEEANRAKSRFLAKASHELRTPLNSIIGFSSLLHQGLAGPMSDTQRSHVEIINASGRHLLLLVDDILDLSRVEAGGLAVRTATVDPTALVSEVVEAVRPLCAGRGISLRAEVPHGTFTIQSDAAKLKEILLNLAENGVKYTEKGEVVVRWAFPDAAHIEFSVSDTGVGISPEAMPRIFEAFVQVVEAESQAVQGIGLGLAISHEYASLLGGELSATSTVGAGSTFTLTLPT